MVDLDHVLTEIEDPAQGADGVKRIGGRGCIGRRIQGENILHISGRDRVPGALRNGGSESLARLGNPSSVYKLSAHYMLELAAEHCRIGDARGGSGVGDNPTSFVGKEEESLIFLLINLRNPHWTSEGAAKIVVA